MATDHGLLQRLSSDSYQDSSSDSDMGDSSFSEKALLIAPSSLSSPFSQSLSFQSIRSTAAKLAPFTKRLLIYLLPSYIQRIITPHSSTATTTRKTNNITALDGLRGLACLFVFNEHYSYNYTTTFLYGYGFEDRRHIVQWPILRIPWSGFSMVAIFYVVSGYVLSCKPLRQSHQRDISGFQTSMTSSVLRRGLRLYLPPIVGIFTCAMFVQLGAFKPAAKVWEMDDNYLGLHEHPPPQFPDLISQLSDASKVAFRLLNVWSWSDDLSSEDYDRHTWTIPVEFRCSMVLFLVLIATARLRQTIRLLFVSASIAFCIATDRKDVILFLAGMLLAELDMIRRGPSGNEQLLPGWISGFRPPHWSSRLKLSPCIGGTKRYRKLNFPTWPVLFVLGLYAASAPVIGCESTPGFVRLSSLVPSSVSDKSNFLRSIGAVLVTWAVANSNILKPLFTNPFSAYLGQISFALYLVHGNVLKSAGYASMPFIYAMTGARDENAGVERLLLAWATGLLIVLPITFWASDLFWRMVDMPCVRFARWVEEKISRVEENDDAMEEKLLLA